MKPAPIDPPQIWSTLWKGVKGTTGWDIGANCGQTIPIMLERFQQVYAFEPAEECWPDLEQRAQDRLAILHLALSDTDGDIDLIALPDKIDTGQLVTTGTHGMEWDPDHPSRLLRTVPARTIDSLTNDGIPAPDFMKIDVEGHEMLVLFGAKRTLSITRPDLLIEFHSPQLYDDLHHYLESFGYGIDTIRHPHYPEHSAMWMTHGWLRASVIE